MHELITITPDDLRQALLRGARLTELAGRLQRRLKLPSASRTASSVLFHLQQRSPALHDLVASWMRGGYPAAVRPGALQEAALLPFCPRGIDVQTYLAPRLKKMKPSVVAVDASAAEVGAALHYASSLFYGLGIPALVTLADVHGILREELFMRPGDFLPELALMCYQQKMALVPLGTPVRHIPSEYQHNYSQLLSAVQAEFCACPLGDLMPEALEELSGALMQSLFGAGPHLSMERNDIITRSCGVASRLYDLVRYLSGTKQRGGPVLLLHRLRNSLDLPALIDTFRQSPGALRELYCEPDQQDDGTLALAACEDETVEAAPGVTSRTAAKSHQAIIATILERMSDLISSAEVDRLAAELVQALREHPRVERPPGVRGTLATREIAQSLGLLRGGVSRSTLAQAAAIALEHRSRIAQGEGPGWAEVFKSLVSRIVYGIPLFPEADERRPQKKRALTPDELDDALAGLMNASFSQLDPNAAVPLDDPDFAAAAMQHPQVQQALKDALQDGLRGDLREDYGDLMQQLADRGLMEQVDAAGMTLTEAGREQLEGSLEDSLARGDITPEELAEALSKARGMPQAPSAGGETVQLPAQAQTELLAELMDFQHQGRSESSSLEDLYVHYSIDKNKGLGVSKEKVDYEKLKVILHQLEKEGKLQVSSDGQQRFTLTHRALEGLLEGLVRRQESRMLERRAFRREHEIDKSEVRRYRRGDVFRDISLRHTLRRVIRKGKALEDINYTDLRAFEKKPSNQLDIAVCVDISASMKESGKLRYAKMAVAELCKAAIEKHDRVGIVAFSNLGDVVVPLTDKITLLLEATMHMRVDQFTNIGNGLSTARRMLQKTKKENPKYIILITDGEPNAALADDAGGSGYHRRVAAFSRGTSMETKRALGARHALQEAAKTSRDNINISVVYIAPPTKGIDESEKTAREIARIGGGKFHRVKAVERLPLGALEAVG